VSHQLLYCCNFVVVVGFLFVLSFWWQRGFELRVSCLCKAGALALEPHLQSSFIALMVHTVAQELGCLNSSRNETCFRILRAVCGRTGIPALGDGDSQVWPNLGGRQKRVHSMRKEWQRNERKKQDARNGGT
jgi:hypothetical protein